MSTEDEFMTSLIEKFGKEVVTLALDKYIDLDKNGSFAVLTESNEIIRRGTRSECLEWWAEHGISKDAKVAEMFYDIEFDLDRNTYQIPDNLSINSIVIE